MLTMVTTLTMLVLMARDLLIVHRALLFLMFQVFQVPQEHLKEVKLKEIKVVQKVVLRIAEAAKTIDKETAIEADLNRIEVVVVHSKTEADADEIRPIVKAEL